jgi:hypothetical protein
VGAGLALTLPASCGQSGPLALTLPASRVSVLELSNRLCLLLLTTKRDCCSMGPIFSRADLLAAADFVSVCPPASLPAAA